MCKTNIIMTQRSNEEIKMKSNEGDNEAEDANEY